MALKTCDRLRPTMRDLLRELNDRPGVLGRQSRTRLDRRPDQAAHDLGLWQANNATASCRRCSSASDNSVRSLGSRPDSPAERAIGAPLPFPFARPGGRKTGAGYSAIDR